MRQDKKKVEKTNLKFWKYLQYYKKDVWIDFNPDIIRQGTIFLYGKAYEHKDCIYYYLELRFPQYTFTPDFIAGNGRIEFYIRQERKQNEKV